MNQHDKKPLPRPPRPPRSPLLQPLLRPLLRPRRDGLTDLVEVDLGALLRENEELKLANEQLARENERLLNEHVTASQEADYHRGVSEIQRESLRNIRSFINISTADCRTKIREKQEAWSEGKRADQEVDGQVVAHPMSSVI